jgi:non-heme chloroperoxidase
VRVVSYGNDQEIFDSPLLSFQIRGRSRDIIGDRMKLFKAGLLPLLLCSFCFCLSASPSDLREDLQKIQVRGVELHYRISGTGQPFIFVHGGLADYRELQPVAAGLSDQYRTIVYSRRYNFPNKNDLPLENFSAATEAEDLAALIHGLKLNEVTVVGVSYGAYTALMLAVRYPDLVARLVLVEPPLMEWLKEIPGGPAVYEDFIRRLWAPVRKALKEDQASQAVKTAVDFFVGPGGMDQLPAEVIEMIRVNLLEWKVLTASTDVFPRISRDEVRGIRKPVLMLSGGNSYDIGKLLDPEIEKQLQNVKRIIIPDGTHDVCSQLPGSCSKEILKFLTEHPFRKSN